MATLNLQNGNFEFIIYDDKNYLIQQGADLNCSNPKNLCMDNNYNGDFCGLNLSFTELLEIKKFLNENLNNEKIAYFVLSEFWGFDDYDQDVAYTDAVSGYANFYNLLKGLVNQNFNYPDLYFPTCCLYGEVVADYSDLSPKELLKTIKERFLQLGGVL